MNQATELAAFDFIFLLLSELLLGCHPLQTKKLLELWFHAAVTPAVQQFAEAELKEMKLLEL